MGQLASYMLHHSIGIRQFAGDTHTYPFNGPLSGTTRVSRYQKGKTNLDLNEARGSEWQWHQLGHMQVCTSLQTDNHASTPSLSFLQVGCPSCRWRRRIIGNKNETRKKPSDRPYLQVMSTTVNLCMANSPILKMQHHQVTDDDKQEKTRVLVRTVYSNEQNDCLIGLPFAIK